MTKASRDLEILVTKIQKQLAPQADVIHDVRLEGRHTGRKRQIDVLVREYIGQYEIKIIIDCKDYKTPADVKAVEEFYGLMDDVGAQKGVLVCPRGFTATAKIRAEGYQVDLYSPVDTDAHKWTAKVSIPALCDFRKVLMSFKISGSAPGPMRFWPDFFSSQMIYDSDTTTELGFALERASEKWNTGLFPTDLGEHLDLKIFDRPVTLIDNGYGMKVPVEITVSALVQRELYFGQMPVARLSGFKDELTGQVITNAFTTGVLSVEEVERDWKLIERKEDAPVRPVITLLGAVMWGQ